MVSAICSLRCISGRGRVEMSTARGTLPISRSWLKAGFGVGGKGGCLGKEDMGG